MFSKLRFLFLLIFVVLWSSGHGYFFRRWESTAAPEKSEKSHVGQAHGFSDIRGGHHNFNWGRPVAPYQAESVVPPLAAAIPFPIAIQFPHQFLPLAMFPAIHAPMQSFKSAPHYQYSQTASPIPFVKISQSLPPVSVPPQTIAAVRFVPCLCGSGKAPAGYVGNAGPTYAAHASSFQQIHLLPCYCPMVRDVDSQYVQSSPVPTVTESPSYNYPTSTEPALKS